MWLRASCGLWIAVDGIHGWEGSLRWSDADLRGTATLSGGVEPPSGERKGLRPETFTVGEMAQKPSLPRLSTTRSQRVVSHPSDAFGKGFARWQHCLFEANIPHGLAAP
ncbi:MAG: hypothetical protein ACI4A8_00060 [Muribaculaceae bacterium]